MCWKDIWIVPLTYSRREQFLKKMCILITTLFSKGLCLFPTHAFSGFSDTVNIVSYQGCHYKVLQTRWLNTIETYLRVLQARVPNQGIRAIPPLRLQKRLLFCHTDSGTTRHPLVYGCVPQVSASNSTWLSCLPSLSVSLSSRIILLVCAKFLIFIRIAYMLVETTLIILFYHFLKSAITLFSNKVAITSIED